MQKEWKSQQPASLPISDSSVILQQVQRGQREFRRTIFWRDVRELSLSFLLALYFFNQAWLHSDWSDALLALAVGGVGAFLLLNRMAQKRNRPVPSGTLQSCVRASILELDHQIWLLKNVGWWYLLPIATALIISFVRRVGPATNPGSFKIMHLGVPLLVIFILFVGIYRINQSAVHRTLEPRRIGLLELKKKLEAQALPG